MIKQTTRARTDHDKGFILGVASSIAFMVNHCAGIDQAARDLALRDNMTPDLLQECDADEYLIEAVEKAIL